MSVGPDSIMGMKYGLDISPAGDWGRPDQLAELAGLAEDHGWDGVFCEDYLAFPGGLPTYDVWVALGLVAQLTTRITIGTMVTPLPARYAPTVALAARSVAAVSDGRLVLGVGSGDPVGDPVIGDASAARAPLLEAALAEIRRTVPEVPVWVGGAATKPGPRARALRWDGACLSTGYHRHSGRTSRLTTSPRCGRTPAGHPMSSLSAAASAPTICQQSAATCRRWPRPARTGGMSTCHHGCRWRRFATGSRVDPSPPEAVETRTGALALRGTAPRSADPLLGRRYREP